MSKLKTDETTSLKMWSEAMKEFSDLKGDKKEGIEAWFDKWHSNNSLSYRQRDAIYGRFINVSEGSYGKQTEDSYVPSILNPPKKETK